MGKRERDKGARFEREIARRTGGERTGCLGKRNTLVGFGDIIHHPNLYIECKRRKSFSICSVFEEVEKTARELQKIPVLVIREDRGKPLAVVSLDDLEEVSRMLQKIPPQNPSKTWTPKDKKMSASKDHIVDAERRSR
ncbi:MAG: putative PDDEXK endonuclease [bacterium JZ-2024 1]